MNTYTIKLFTEFHWAQMQRVAETPEQALAEAHKFAENHGFRELDFLNYDRDPCVEAIDVSIDGETVAEWQGPRYQLRLAAGDLLTALEQAVAALNSVPRFTVPSLNSDSYRVALICDEAIAKAKGGASC
jgi:hypothetical protein